MLNSIKNSTFLIFLSALFTCVPQLHAPSIATRPRRSVFSRIFSRFHRYFTPATANFPQKIVLTLLTSPKLWYNVFVTATANAELMKDRCPSESDCQGEAAGRALSVRTNVLVTATANAELMKRFRLYSFGSAARPESAKHAKRVI